MFSITKLRLRAQIPARHPDVLTTPSTLFRLLERYDIGAHDIACLSGVSEPVVRQALSLGTFEYHPVIEVARVRAAVEHLLVRRGWHGDGERLWAPFTHHTLARRGATRYR